MQVFVNLAQTMAKMMEGYALKVFNHLSPGCLSVFSSLFVLTIVARLMRAAFKGEETLEGALKPFLKGMTVVFFLSTHHFMGWIYTPLIQTSSELIQETLRVLARDVSTHEATIYGALYTIHDIMAKLFIEVDNLMKDTSFFWGINQTASFILRIPFMFLFGMILFHNLNFMFKFMALTSIAPLLIIFAAFSSTRSCATTALRMVCHGTLTMVFSVLGVGLAIYLLKEVIGQIPAGTAFAFSESYFMCLMAVCIAVFLQLQAPTLAGIVGVHDGPGPAALVSGAFVGLFALAQSYTARTSGRLMRGAGQTLQRHAWQPAKEIIRQKLYKNPFKPSASLPEETL